MTADPDRCQCGHNESDHDEDGACELCPCAKFEPEDDEDGEPGAIFD